MELLLYDFEGNELAFSDKIISSYREVFFNDIGTSEFHLELSDSFSKVISENPYLILEQDGIFQDIVVGCKTDEDFTIYCRSLSWLLTKMLVPPMTFSGTVTETAKKLFESSLGCDITLGNLPTLKNEFSFESSKVTLLSDSLKSCLDTAYAGHKVRFSHEDNAFYLDILKGQDLNLYVSENDCTLERITLEKDIIDVSNSFCYLKRFTTLGTWNPYSNSPALYSGRVGNFGKCYRVLCEHDDVSRFNISWNSGDYIYCSSSDGKWKKSGSPPDPVYVYIYDDTVSDKYQWFHISDKDTENEALLSLYDYQINQSFSAAARNISFLKDYNLGDFVKLQYTINNTTVCVPCQFSGVTLSRDRTNTVENPTLKEVK